MHDDFSTSGFSDALVILGAAGIVIPAFARLRISPVIGFILVGMIVGPFGLGALTQDIPWLHYVTISNAEANRALRRARHRAAAVLDRARAIVPTAVGACAGWCSASARPSCSCLRVLVGGGLYLTGESVSGAIALGLALALSSTAIVLPLVGTHGPVGRSALAMLLFEDLALVPIVFLLGAMAPTPADRPSDRCSARC